MIRAKRLGRGPLRLPQSRSSMASSLICLGEENDADDPENPPSGNSTSSEGRIVLICDDTSGCASLLQRKGDSPFAVDRQM